MISKYSTATGSYENFIKDHIKILLPLIVRAVGGKIRPLAFSLFLACLISPPSYALEQPTCLSGTTPSPSDIREIFGNIAKLAQSKSLLDRSFYTVDSLLEALGVGKLTFDRTNTDEIAGSLHLPNRSRESLNSLGKVTSRYIDISFRWKSLGNGKISSAIRINALRQFNISSKCADELFGILGKPKEVAQFVRAEPFYPHPAKPPPQIRYTRFHPDFSSLVTTELTDDQMIDSVNIYQENQSSLP